VRRSPFTGPTLFDLGALFAVKGAIGAYVLHAGFSHVSDDDFARVVIAERFAHHPVLDPSGTSWLPFPFWVTGAAMLALGRSLAVAKAVAFVLGVASVAAPYLAMRAVGCARGAAFTGTAVAMALPWSAWLGVATVPEAMTAALVSGGVIAAGSARWRILAATALSAAALSRYEAWPACAVVALGCALTAFRSPVDRRRAAVAAAIACAGPLAWMAWNVYAHGSAVHFLARVAAYRQAIGAAALPFETKLLAFPEAVVETAPAAVALAALGSLALVLDPTLRPRWGLALASAFAILAFLVYGDLRDGAPTHHPERAILPILWILVAFAADALGALVRRYAWGRSAREMWVAGGVAAGALAWCAQLPGQWRDHPGASAEEARDVQVTRGLELARARAPHIDVTPCAYEHFAVLAAFGAPERAEVEAPTHTPVTPACPRIATN
jgi:hypothetical protein